MQNAKYSWLELQVSCYNVRLLPMVFLNSFYILLFLFALGLPLSLLCRRPNLGHSNLLLAPHFGLVCVTVLVSNAYLLNVPVSKTVVPMLGLTILAFAYGVWRLWQLRGKPSDTRQHRGLIPFLVPSILGVLVIGIYGLPFILNPRLEYYAYAGTDGSAYITTSEYLMTHGSRDPPAPDFYHPFSGLIAAFTGIKAMDKPGTFADLAFFSVLLHRLPHQLFSCLMLLASALLFSSCYVFARSLQHGPVAAGFGAFLGALCPSLLVLTSDTYLGASLTLPLMPAILFLAGDALEKKSAAVLLALTCSAYWLISPPSWMIPLTFGGLYLLYAAWKRVRVDRKDLVIDIAVFCAALIAASAVPAHFIKTLDIVGFAFAPQGPMSADYRAWGWAIFWHAIGVGDIISSPASMLGALGRFALCCTALAGIVYIVINWIRRRFSVLFFAYLALWIMVLIGGVLQGFQNFVVLGRVSEQVAFLHALVYVALFTEVIVLLRKRVPPAARAPKRPLKKTKGYPTPSGRGSVRGGERGAPILSRDQRKRRVVLGWVAFPFVLFVAVYPIRPFVRFEREALLEDTQRTNQFERSAFEDRARIVSAGGALPALISPVVSDPTGILHIAALFTNIEVLPPPDLLKFFLLNGRPIPDDYYCAKSVLIPELYTDIADVSRAPVVFQGAGYHLISNDLVPLLDVEAFPIKNAFDIYFLKQRRLIQERTLSRPTAIHVCSAMPRTIRIEVRYAAPNQEQQVAFRAYPSDGTSAFTLGSQGWGSTGRLSLSKGENRIEVTRSVGSEPVAIRSISIVPDP